MAFRKVFQERLGNNGKRDKIQRETVPSITDFLPRRMHWPSPTPKFEVEEKLWAEFFRIELTINNVLSIFFDEQSQEVGASYHIY